MVLRMGESLSGDDVGRSNGSGYVWIAHFEYTSSMVFCWVRVWRRIECEGNNSFWSGVCKGIEWKGREFKRGVRSLVWDTTVSPVLPTYRRTTLY